MRPMARRSCCAIAAKRRSRTDGATSCRPSAFTDPAHAGVTDPAHAGVTDPARVCDTRATVLGWSGTGPRILFWRFLSLSSRRQGLHFPAMLLEGVSVTDVDKKRGDFVDANAARHRWSAV